MKLFRTRIQNYRSIVDSGVVELEERVTVLIGKNEQGKTNFQRGLATLSSATPYRAMDLPRHLRAQLENLPPDQIPVVDAWFKLEANDQEKLSKVLPEGAQVLRVTRFYDEHYSYSITAADGEVPLEPRPADVTAFIREIKSQAETLRGKLRAHGERLAEFKPSIEPAGIHLDSLLSSKFDDQSRVENLVKTFSTAIKAVPGQDPAIQEDIAQTVASMNQSVASIQQAMTRDFYAPIRAALPKFVLHHTITDKIPDFVEVGSFVADPKATSPGMANLCAVAGLSMQKIQQLADTTDAPERETFEDHYRGTISGGINEFWTQEHYTVHFRLEPSRLSVSISDGTYSQRIQPSDRSDGFQWYLSFYAAILSDVSDEGLIVLLLDNPGLELHADGQRDIKRFLEEKLPQSVQVAYVTHSPAMIDTFRLEQVRQIELRGNSEGTKVGPLAVKDGNDFDLLEPVRSAIGASLAYSLMAGELNVLVEGAADKPILDAAFRLLADESASRKPVVNGSISENTGLLPKFYQRARLPFVAFIDADSGGRDLLAQLKSWGILPAKIADLAEAFPDITGRDFELEDVLSVDFYHRAVTAAYPEQPVSKPDAAATKKRTKHYETQFRETHNVGFSKRRAAENVYRLWRDGNGDTETAKNLKKIVEFIWAKLKAQVELPKAPEA